ncbi:MAG: AMP-binding protein [Planctomycetota bacterium]
MARELPAGARVACFAPQHPSTLIAMLACWQAGAVVLPVDNAIAPEALRRIIDLYHPDLLLYGAERGLTHAERRLCQELALAQRPVAARRIAATRCIPEGPDADTPALVIYTSGSTGEPKGVVLNHGNLAAGIANVGHGMALGREDTALCVLPLSHINGLVTTFLTPSAIGGRTVHLQEPFTARAAEQLIHEHDCTWLSAIPVHYRMLLQQIEAPARSPVSTLRFCRSAAAPLDPQVLRDFESAFQVPLLETMGMSEAAGQICANPMPPAIRKAGSIGLPVGFDIDIRHPDGSSCRVDEVGELVLRGPALMPGYLDDPVATAAAIRDGWLHSGDQAYRDADGYVHICGRLKDIAIFAGENIGLRSLEQSLETDSAIAEAACTGVPDPIYGEVIRVHVLPAPQQQAFGDLCTRVQRLLLPLLPDAQALEQILVVDRMPRSNVGKLLKGRLREVRVRYRHGSVAAVDARGIVAVVLRRDREDIPADARAADLGSWNSLAHLQIMLSLERQLGRRIAPMEYPSLLSIAGIDAVLSGTTIDGNACGLRDQERSLQVWMRELLDLGFGQQAVNHCIISFDACLRRGIHDPHRLLEHLLDHLPANQTLVMNAFTWDFCRGSPYHWRTSPCRVGLLNECFREHPTAKRSPHPIYSFIASGDGAADLLRHDSPSCWGPGSTCRRLLDDDGVRVFAFGVPVLYRNAALHAMEEEIGVPFRYFKSFSGQACLGPDAGTQDYQTRMYVRDLERGLESCWDPLREPLLDAERLQIRQEWHSYRPLDVATIARPLLAADPLLLASREEQTI